MGIWYTVYPVNPTGNLRLPLVILSMKCHGGIALGHWRKYHWIIIPYHFILQYANIVLLHLKIRSLSKLAAKASP